jgi:late control gene D protein (GPD)
MGLGILIKLDGTADPELAAANVVEVHERMGEPTTFRIEYPVDIGNADLTLLGDARLAPGAALAVAVPVGGEEQILAWGPVHGHRIHLVHGGTGSTLEVIGGDRCVEMDREVKMKIWDSVTASDVVSSIAADYGLTPDMEDTPEQHIEDKHTLVQADTDLRFVHRLARRYGYLFWISTDATGTHTAHFRRPQLDGDVAATLVINKAGSTLNSLDIAWDVERPTSVLASQVNLGDKADIVGDTPATPLTALGTQDLATIAPGTRNVHVVAPVDDADDLTARAEGALIEAGWFIRATGETYLHALGTVVRAHTIVEVQGAGALHSGKYFVAGVRHTIDAAAHVMELSLIRNAWGTS